MITRYFDQTVGGWQRIAVVESASEFSFEGFNWDDEISEANLPSGFNGWKHYETLRLGGNEVHVLSQDGN
jgi:hypothetical protein